MSTKSHSEQLLLFPVGRGTFATSPDWPAVIGEAYDAAGLRALHDQGRGVVIAGDLSAADCAILASLAQAGYRLDQVRLAWRRGEDKGHRDGLAIVKTNIAGR